MALVSRRKAWVNKRLRDCGIFLAYPFLAELDMIDSIPLPDGRRYCLVSSILPDKDRYYIIEVTYTDNYKLIKIVEGYRLDTTVLLYS